MSEGVPTGHPRATGLLRTEERARHNHRNWLSANLIVSACFAAAPVLAQGSSWFLDGCDAIHQTKADHLRQEMLKAQPGSDVYVPKPFPRTDADVVARFRGAGPRHLLAPAR